MSVCAAGLLAPVSRPVHAQGVTTVSVRGFVTTTDANDVDGARVTIVNTATGFILRSEVRHGRFLFQGLEVGGPYTLTVSRVGFQPERRAGLFLQLGEPVELRLVLQPMAILLDTLHIGGGVFGRANAHGGTATFISDSLLHRLPSLNRNLYDFVRLSPQVSTRIGFAGGGMSAGGVGFRFNSFLLDGVSQRTIPGGVPLEFAGLRTVPLDAVREYQVLIAPFDVRFGDFAGALVNAVTRAGTNRFEGSAFAHGRTDRLGRSRDAGGRYERMQYGATVSGPLWQDRIQFLAATEFQHFTAPAPGPYIGQPAAADPPVPVSAADIARLDSIVRGHGLVAGSGAAIENGNPLSSIFARIDAALPEWGSRAVFTFSDARARNRAFSRPARTAFPLTSNEVTQLSSARTSSLRVHTSLARAAGGSNELLVSHRSAASRWRPQVRQPLIRIVVPGVSGGAVEIVTGTPQHAHGVALESSAVALRNDLSLPLGRSHVAAIGIELERFDVDRGGLTNSYGTWRFSTLDSLALGLAESYQVAVDMGGAEAPIRGGRYAAYAGDDWHVSRRFALTFGLRGDVLAIDRGARFNPVVDSIFGRRTDQLPQRRIHFSPRLGFTWEAGGQSRIRGGIGVFTGSPPIAWLHSAVYAHGSGTALLRCGSLPGDVGSPPPFEPDVLSPPIECANRRGATGGTAEVSLLDTRLRMPRTLRAAVAWERRLPGRVSGTIEALLTRSISDYMFVNLNLQRPEGVDAHGRVLYGTFGPTGLPTPSLRSGFAEVIELRNTSHHRAAQLAIRLERQFANGGAVVAHYAYARVRDVQTPLRVATQNALNWASRAVAGRHDELSRGVSLNDVPHRVVIAGTQRAPWRRWVTEISFYYVGESGSPFTYVAYGTGRRGDLNADGSNTNDPVYVPRSAFDPLEIRFDGLSPLPAADNSEAAQSARIATQQASFERFIARTPCLLRQRGRLLKRNSCREPWSHTTVVSIRQLLPVGGRGLVAQLDIYNVLNLLSRQWGLHRVAVPRLLEHVDQIPGPASQPVFRFNDTDLPWTKLQAESAFQLQLGLRYGF